LGANLFDVIAPSDDYHLAITRTDAGVTAGTIPADQMARSSMDARISEAERQRRARQRALSIQEFSQVYGLGRTKVYEELKSGRLRGRKIGKRTIITEDDAEDWLRRLPVIEAAP
jgi:excisionase family DNA binding protein